MLLFLSNTCIQMHPNKPKTSRPGHWEPSRPLFLCPAALTAADFGLLEPTPRSTAPLTPRDRAHGEPRDLVKILMIKTTKKLQHKLPH